MSNSTTPSSSSSSTPSSNTPSATPPAAIEAIGRIGTLTSPAEAAGRIGELKLDGGGRPISPGGVGNQSPVDEILSPDACARVDASSGYGTSSLEEIKNFLLKMKKSPELAEKAIEESAGDDYTLESVLEKVEQLEKEKANKIYTELKVEELNIELKETKEDVENLNKVIECKVCLDQWSKIICLPCRHRCMCLSCSDTIDPQICPICREPIVGKLEVNYA